MLRKYKSNSAKQQPSPDVGFLIISMRVSMRVCICVCCLFVIPLTANANLTANDEYCADVALASDLRLNTIEHHNTTQHSTQRSELSFVQFIEKLKQARVVVIGETHDDWAHHLTQLEIICQLVRVDGGEARDASWRDAGIGFEQFQTSSQSYLDSFAAGTASISQLLKGTDYFTTWGYDFRLYEPIVSWAAENGMTLLALNASTEVVELVRAQGLASLQDDDGSKLPFATEPVSEGYRQRLQQIFDQHAGVAEETDVEIEPADFQRFIDVQRTWEGTMSTTAFEWLERNPTSRLIVVVGAGHMIWPETIPDQLREKGVRGVVSVGIDIDRYEPDPDAAETEGSGLSHHSAISVDFSLRALSKPLLSAGKLGVALETKSEGVYVSGFSPASAAQAAGIEVGDRLVEINAQAVQSYADVRQLLWKSIAGNVVEVRAIRNGAEATKVFSFPLK